MSPSGFLSLKLFGNELDLFTLKDLEWIQEDDIPLADIIDFIRRLSKGINETYTKNMVFMEETYVIPTCLGIPLNVSINGTSVGSVYVHGKADLLNMFWGKKSAIVKGTIKPRYSIERLYGDSRSAKRNIRAYKVLIWIMLGSESFSAQ